jgi:uncharacterized membrane protein YebE (DUF533 family)
MKIGEKIAVHIQGEELPTMGEIMEVKERGQELLIVIRAARADGRIEFHEVILIAGKVVGIASLGIWRKVGAWFKRVFGRKG